MQAAFNSGEYYTMNGLDALQRGLDDRPSGKLKQGGVHYYTLCERCNELTGRWYGNAYKNWAYTGLQHLIAADGNPELFTLHHTCPGRVMKEIICMFLSVNAPEFGDRFPYLRRFVLNKDLRGLPPEVKVYAYYTLSRKLRYAGLTAFGKLPGRPTYLSEISAAPYGYILTVKSSRPDSRLFDISGLANYGFNQFTDISVRLRNLPVLFPIPGDFRTKSQIEADHAANIASERKHIKHSPDYIAHFRSEAKRNIDQLISYGVNADGIVAVMPEIPECLLDGPSQLTESLTGRRAP